MTTRSNTTSHSEWSTAPDKSFVTTRPFNLEFYQYSVSRSDRPPYTTTGVLVLHSSATAPQCPAGRVIHANGKKLIPDVNVMNSFTTPAGATIQAKKFMLGVYDPESMLNGYIDPTSATFAVYDKNRPASDYLLYATGNTTEATALLGLGGQGSRLPAKVLIGNPATTIAAGDSSVGRFTATTVAGIAGGANAILATVSTTAVTANSIILLTANNGYSANTNTSFSISLCIGNIIPGSSFQVYLTNIQTLFLDGGTNVVVNWLIIN
jgi:hypothetical protein